MSQTAPAPDAARAAEPAGARSGRQVTAIVGVLSLAVFMSSLDLFIVNLAFPYIGRQYPGTSLGSLSWVLNGYTIVFAAVLVPAGRWADRVGRRRVLIGGLGTFVLGSVLCGVAPGVAALIAARILQAVGAGLMVPASLSLVLAAVPPRARPQALGTWSALGALGAALGPVIGGSLVQFSWRWVFWINVPVGLAAIALAYRVVPESKDDQARGRPDLIGAGLLAAAVGLVALALVKAPDWGWGSPAFLGVLLAVAGLRGSRGGPVAAAPFPGHRTRTAPLPDLQRRLRRLDPVLRRVRRLRAQLGRVPHRRVALLRRGRWAWPSRQGRSWCCRSPASSRPAWRAWLGGPGRAAVIGCAVNAAGQLLWLTQIQARPAYLTHLLPAQLLGGAGVGLAIPSLLAAGSAALTPARFGTGSGILNTARQVGTVLGVAGLVAILTHISRADPHRQLSARPDPDRGLLRRCRCRDRRRVPDPAAVRSGCPWLRRRWAAASPPLRWSRGRFLTRHAAGRRQAR